jgi:hypothetical protein
MSLLFFSDYRFRHEYQFRSATEARPMREQRDQVDSQQ